MPKGLAGMQPDWQWSPESTLGLVTQSMRKDDFNATLLTDLIRNGIDHFAVVVWITLPFARQEFPPTP
jgi:hypothetical protein